MKTLTLPPQAAQVGLAVDVAAFAMHESELQVLLVQRGTLPHAQVWALPGGFVQLHEELHEAALRELREETSISLEPRHLEQFYTFGAPERDPRGRIVSVAHLAVLPHGTVQVTGVRARWPPAGFLRTRRLRWPLTMPRFWSGPCGVCRPGWNTHSWPWSSCLRLSPCPNCKKSTKRSWPRNSTNAISANACWHRAC